LNDKRRKGDPGITGFWSIHSSSARSLRIIKTRVTHMETTSSKPTAENFHWFLRISLQ
jgi:hypothetical protein